MLSVISGKKILAKNSSWPWRPIKKTYIRKSSVDNFTTIVEKSRLRINLIQQFPLKCSLSVSVQDRHQYNRKSRNESRSVLFYTLCVLSSLSVCNQPIDLTIICDGLWLAYLWLIIHFPMSFLVSKIRFRFLMAMRSLANCSNCMATMVENRRWWRSLVLTPPPNWSTRNRRERWSFSGTRRTPIRWSMPVAGTFRFQSVSFDFHVYRFPMGAAGLSCPLLKTWTERGSLWKIEKFFFDFEVFSRF